MLFTEDTVPAPCYLDKHLVAVVVTHCIVNVLEVVDIYKGNGEFVFFTEISLHRKVERTAVGQRCERIGMRHLVKLMLVLA